MNYNLYVIFDKVAQEASFPFDAKNDEVAKRRFEDTVNRQIRSVKTVSLSDYELRFIGEFDSEHCLLNPFTDIDSVSASRIVCGGEDVDLWPQEEVDKLTAPAPTFNMDALRDLLALQKNTAGSPTPAPKKKHFWQK